MKIDTHLVRCLIAAQFPQWADLSIRPVESGGWDNRTFHLGERLSVRLPSAEQYAAQVAKEQKCLPQLSPYLPLPIPMPVAKGVPGENYPWHWSVYCWLEGETASLDNIANLRQFAATLASFLSALQKIDTQSGFPPGAHNFYRGGDLSTYDKQTRGAIEVLRQHIDFGAVTAVWEAGLKSTWDNHPVWLHGDVSAANMLVRNGRLVAVIDFGCCAIGDPACDLTIAWTFLSGASRESFRAALHLDENTWARARGWAMWKALITWAESVGDNSSVVQHSQHVIDQILADHFTAKINSVA